MKTFSLYLLVILLTSSCALNFSSTNESSIIGSWHLYDIEQIKNTKSDNSFSKEVELKNMVKEGAMICFFKDQSYSDLKGNGEFKSGDWKFLQEGQSVCFIYSGRATDTIEIEIDKNLSGKQVLALSYKQKNITLKFIKESEPLKVFEDDPFYKNNNTWRIKPKQPENVAELKSRLSNYFKHLALVLKAAKERKQDVVLFAFSQGPIKIYNGGIGIYPYDIVPQSWKDSFYDDGDALTAYHKYEDYLTTSSYKGAGSGEWIEDDYNILLSIYSGFNQSVVKSN